MIFCEKRKVCVEKQHESKGWKCRICYKQMCNVNQHQCFMPVLKNPEAGQGYNIYAMVSMQETRKHDSMILFLNQL